MIYEERIGGNLDNLLLKDKSKRPLSRNSRPKYTAPTLLSAVADCSTFDYTNYA